MKDLLLIKKIDNKMGSTDLMPVTFDLDEKFKRSIAMDIFNDLAEKSIIQSNRFTIKDCSFTIDILPSSITRVIEEIIKRDLDIYGIYILYDNYIYEGE